MSRDAANDGRLIAMFHRLGIAWDKHEHEAVFTVEASAALHVLIPGAHTKNLFLKDAGGRFWLVSAPHDAQIDLKALPSVIGAKKLSFAKAEDMVRLLGVAPGSVTPLAAINDLDHHVTVVIDSRLAASDRVNIHPLRNNATLGLSGDDLLAFLVDSGHSPLVAKLPA